MSKDREVRILASSPDYEEINLLTTKIAMLKNPHLHKIVREAPQLERADSLAEHEQELQQLLDFQKLPFNEVIKRTSLD